MIFQDLRFSKNFFLKNSDFECYRKMYRLGPCIPIFRGGVLIKSAKRMCMCEYVIFGIDTF